MTGAERVRLLDPRLAVSVTLTGDSNKYLPEFTDNLLAGMDIISINTYCLNEDLTVNTPAEWADVLARWRVTARDKQIFIQELGCPVGFGGDTVGPFAGRANINNGSAQIQADFFEFYLSRIASDP